MRFICVPSFSNKAAWDEVSEYALYCHYAGTAYYDNLKKFVVESKPGSTFQVGIHLLIRVKNEPEKSGEWSSGHDFSHSGIG